MTSRIPQFYLPAGARIAHGVLLAASCVWLAAALAKARVAELSRVT
jgi:hypothetical protein